MLLGLIDVLIFYYLKSTEYQKFYTFNSLTEHVIALSALAKARYGASSEAVGIHSTSSAIFPTLACARFVKICCHRKLVHLAKQQMKQSTNLILLFKDQMKIQVKKMKTATAMMKTNNLTKDMK